MPLRLFASPDEVAETNHYEIAHPASSAAGFSPTLSTASCRASRMCRRDERPPVWPVFFSFRIMVGIGFAMLGSGCGACGCAGKAASTTNRWFLRATMVMTPSGFGAVLFGWFTAEIGRQPYVVYGHAAHGGRGLARDRRRGRDVARHLRRRLRFIFGFGSYYLAKLLRKGPEPIEEAARGADFDDRTRERRGGRSRARRGPRRRAGAPRATGR